MVCVFVALGFSILVIVWVRSMHIARTPGVRRVWKRLSDPFLDSVIVRKAFILKLRHPSRNMTWLRLQK